MVSYNIDIGIRKFSSVSEAYRYYYAILYHTEPGCEVPFKYAKDVLFLSIFDSRLNPLLGKHFCNVSSVRVISARFRKKVFCIAMESGESFTLSLNEVFQVIRKDAARAYRKRNNTTVIPKRISISPEKLWKKHLLSFRDACKKLSYTSPGKPKVYGLEAHHANPGGLEFIITSFIVFNNLDFHEKIAAGGFILDKELRKQFLEYHNQKVMWEMVDHETHLAIHQKN